MLQFSKFFLLFISSIYLTGFLQAQQCELEVKLEIVDEHPNTPLAFANVFIKEQNYGASTGENGEVVFSSICPGDYHFIISHLACDAEELFVKIKKDTSIKVYLHHTDHMLNDVELHAEKTQTGPLLATQIDAKAIQDNSNENLANVLENLTGVTTLKNGTGIAKPVVQGLYGNRLTILNNGIAQSGQQWGNDHSPEIDPLVANKIRVIKGVSALEYFGSNAGAIVLIEPGKISNDPHIHGKVNYFFSSNGLGHGLNAQLEQGSDVLAWKINATLKKSGDHRSADYYLNNTGGEEANFSLQLEKDFGEKWKTEFYLSSFNARLGVLRGSHIGNLTDLESALERDVPFFTEEKFSYQIDAPKQQVHHQLAKLKAQYYLSDKAVLEFNLAGQWNLRKEFDIRRSGRTEIPALNLSQITSFAESKLHVELKKHWQLKTGVQFNWTDNTNNPETGILPLIPDYRSYQTALFAKVDKKLGKSFLEYAIRYDNNLQQVVSISRSTPRTIVRYYNNFNNLSTSLSWQYRLSNVFSLQLNSAYAMRNPAINELYSSGLHQGVSGIEEGNVDLKVEKSWKSNFGFSMKTKKIFTFESLAYYQNIQDYIYLQPQEEIRLTIRGAFPVFAYEQTNAQIYGLDLSSKFQFTESFSAALNYSFIKGDNLSENLPLINLPSNQIYAKVAYDFQSFPVGKNQLENTQIEINNRFVFEQKNIQEGQDFLAPPPAYNLLGLKLSTELQAKKLRYRFLVKVDNLLNTKYRDYLNRQRYFSDDMGVNVTVGVKVSF